MTRLVVVGGSDAGISAALRAREVDPTAQVDMLVADRWPNYSICGLPYLLSGEVQRTEDLAHRTRAEIEATGVKVHLDHRALAIDPQARTVTTQARTFAYDALVIGTGATPQRPPIEGLDLDGVHLLHTVDDALAVAATLPDARRAVIVGAGYIGLEMAEALRHRGLAVMLAERLPEVMPTVDPEIGALVRTTLERHGVEVLTGTTVSRIEPGLRVHTTAGTHAADLALVVTGVRPDTALAQSAGANLSATGALAVDRGMWTGVEGIWAAGDCVHTHHRLLDEPVYLPLGTTAHKQGRVAGENAVGGARIFEGVLGTQVVKVFELAVAGTGLRERPGAFTTELVVPDHKRYYPGAVDLTIRVTGDRDSGRLVGAQIAGGLSGQVAKRIDTFATALHHGMTIDAISDLDLSYTPPFSAPWDPVQAAAQNWFAHRSVGP